MILLPIEIIGEILSFNNIKLVFNEQANQYDTKILSFDHFNNIKDIYGSITFYGITEFKSVSDYFIKWYEITYKDKWQIRHLTKLYGHCLVEEEYDGYIYNKKNYPKIRI
jgi:hypothetical protein